MNDQTHDSAGNPITHTTDELVHELLAEFRRDTQHQRARLIEQATRVRNAAMRVWVLAENGHAVNELGELQGNGIELDRLCALYSTARERERGLAHSLGMSMSEHDYAQSLRDS